MAFATNRVHGLGLTLREFWNSTQREIAAHVKVRSGMQASMLAALHNGPSIRQDKQIWTAEMFLSDYSEPKADPQLVAMKSQLDFELMRARMRKATPADIDMQRQIAHRMARVREASDTGASAEQISNIMKGLL